MSEVIKFYKIVDAVEKVDRKRLIGISHDTIRGT